VKGLIPSISLQLLTASVSIVAIHGLNGDAYTTWGAEKSKVSWLSRKDLLPKYLPNARILTWGYNANVTSVKGRSTSADRILQHAQTLVAQLVADRDVRFFLVSQARSGMAD